VKCRREGGLGLLRGGLWSLVRGSKRYRKCFIGIVQGFRTFLEQSCCKGESPIWELKPQPV